MKIFKKVLCALAIVVLISACGSKKESTSNDKVELRISWWGGDTRHASTLEAIKKFEEKYPNIKVKAEYTGFQGHQEKLTTQIAGKTEPDVMQMNWNWLYSFSPDGSGFLDLNEYKDTIKLDNFSKDDLDFGVINKKLNGISISTTGRQMYLNKTTYDKFGVDIPTTWDEYFKAAEKFDAGSYPLDLEMYYAFTLVITKLQQETGKPFISADNKVNYSVDQLAKGIDFYGSLVDKKVVPSVEERSGQGGKAELFEMPNWINGNYAGVYEWTSSSNKYASPLAEQKQELVLAPMPIVKDAKANGLIVKPSMLWSASANSKHPKEAAMLIDFLLNDPEAVAILGLERGVPNSSGAEKVLKDSGVLAGLEYDGTLKVKELVDVPLSPYYEDSELQGVYRSAMEKYGYKQITSKQAAKEIIDAVKAKLESVK